MAWNWIVKGAGSVLMVIGLVAGFGGCSNPQADMAAVMSGWLAFVGGCVLYGAAHIVEFLRKP